MSAEFCDTNVIVYAYAQQPESKHQAAQRVMSRLWGSFEGALSIQVLQELFVTLTRKIVPPLTHEEARTVVSDLATWEVMEPSKADVLQAIDAAARWQISFWDAMVLTTAKIAQASVLWSEDLNDGQDYDGVTVRNPFRGIS